MGGDEISSIEEEAEGRMRDVAMSDEADIGDEIGIDVLDGIEGAI